VRVVKRLAVRRGPGLGDNPNFRFADYSGLIWRALGQIEFRMPFVPFRSALVGVRQRQNG